MTRDPGACTERELVEPALLCTRDGDLNPEALGWSRRPLLEPNLSGHRGRRKRWNYWCITDPQVVSTLQRTVSGIDAALWARLPGLAPGQAIVSFGHMARPLLVAIDPAPCKLRMQD